MRPSWEADESGSPTLDKADAEGAPPKGAFADGCRGPAEREAYAEGARPGCPTDRAAALRVGRASAAVGGATRGGVCGCWRCDGGDNRHEGQSTGQLEAAGRITPGEPFSLA